MAHLHTATELLLLHVNYQVITVRLLHTMLTASQNMGTLQKQPSYCHRLCSSRLPKVTKKSFRVSWSSELPGQTFHFTASQLNNNAEALKEVKLYNLRD